MEILFVLFKFRICMSLHFLARTDMYVCIFFCSLSLFIKQENENPNFQCALIFLPVFI